MNQALGLTGNIGCGKSTVAKLLALYPDVTITDSDSLSKQLLSAPEHFQTLSDIVGARAFASGKPDRSLIASIIFDNPEKRRALELFLYPLIWKELERRTETETKTFPIVESAILYETGSAQFFAGIIVATCDPELQMRRLQENRDMSLDDLRKRMALQLPTMEKVRRADFVIDTSCELRELPSRVEKLHNELLTWRQRRAT